MSGWVTGIVMQPGHPLNPQLPWDNPTGAARCCRWLGGVPKFDSFPHEWGQGFDAAIVASMAHFVLN